MRPRTVYAAGVGLLALWIAVARLLWGALAQAGTERALSPIEGWLERVSHWGVRSTDFVVVEVTLVLVPVLTWLAPRALRQGFPLGAKPRDVLPWLAVALLSWAAFIVIPQEVLGNWTVLVWWSAALAAALTVAVACLAQGELNRGGRGGAPAWGVLYAGLVLQAGFILLMPGILVLGLVPAFTAWRSGRRRPTRR
jgi:hypothetical protein